MLQLCGTTGGLPDAVNDWYKLKNKQMKKYFSYFVPKAFNVLCMLFPILAMAQDILWERSYGGLDTEYLFDAYPTMDNGFLLAGSSLSDASGDRTENNVHGLDYWICKMDEFGTMEWERSFGGKGMDVLISIGYTLDGGFILAGNSTSIKSGYKRDNRRGQEDVWIIKLDPNGEEQWQKTIGGSGKDMVSQILQTSDGGYILGGSSSSPGIEREKDRVEKNAPHYGNLDYWVVKLDSNGIIEWERTYGGQYKDQLESLALTKDNGYILGGYSNSPISAIKSESTKGVGGDYWVLKLDETGEIEWQRTLGGDGDDHLYQILATQDNGYVLGGSSSSSYSGSKTQSNGNGLDFWVLKLDAYGDIIWQQTYDFGEVDILTSLLEGKDGSLYIGGSIQNKNYFQKISSQNKGINDFVFIKTDEKGEKLWKTFVGSSGEEVLRKVILTRDGDYVLAGTSRGEKSRDKNSQKGRSDFWLVKLGDKDKEKEPALPGLEAYPNPTKGFSNIIVNHAFNEGTATLYDIRGRRLQHFEINSRTIPINLAPYMEGIYILNIDTDVKTESIKLIKGTN